MNYPLQLTFKILAFAPQISVADESGNCLFYVKQKLFKFKEAVQIFRDDTRSQHLYDIKADRVIDWSARYTFTTADGGTVGAMKRSGMRSLFAAHYVILNASDMPVFEFEQTNPWIGVLDSLLGEIPILGLVMGYFLNPVYEVKRPGDMVAIMQLIKKKTFLESGFKITKTDAAMNDEEETLVVLSAIMVTLLERARG